MMGENTDTSLFVAVKKGDKDALSILFLRHYDHLFHYGIRINSNKELVEECIQELFLYIFESHDRLGVIKNEKAYLFSSLRRRVLEKIKKARRENTKLDH
jgi:RNA polymerase sigma-70 factor (ECF subfamily)